MCIKGITDPCVSYVNDKKIKNCSLFFTKKHIALIGICVYLHNTVFSSNEVVYFYVNFASI